MDLFDIAVASKLAGGGGGGGEGKAVQIDNRIKGKATSTYTDSGLNLTVAKTGIYDVYWVGYRGSTKNTSGSQLVIDGSDYGEAQETFESTVTNLQCPCISNVSLTEGQVVSLKIKTGNVQYYMNVANLTIIEV